MHFLLSLLMLPPPDWRTPFEAGTGNTTATYAACIAYYQKLAAAYPAQLQLHETGPTDCGQPLHEVVLSADGRFAPAHPITSTPKKPVVFIQNGIHPGEPEGIDASLMLARDLLQQPRLRAQLEARKKADAAFAADGAAQLEWVYQHSPYHKAGHNRYPMLRWLGAAE